MTNSSGSAARIRHFVRNSAVLACNEHLKHRVTPEVILLFHPTRRRCCCSGRSPLGGSPGSIWRGDTRTTEAGTTGHSSRYGAALQRPLEPATTRARCDPPPTARCPLPASHRPLPTAYDLPCRRSAWPPLRRGGAGEAREGMVSSRDGCACSLAACARTRSARAPRCSLRPPLRGAAARWRASPPSQKTRARTGWRGGSTLARGRLSLR